jgi:hypothetical protein
LDAYQFNDKFYILVDYNTHNPAIYKINNLNVIFGISKEEWDKNGWKNHDGFAFREKLFIAGLSTNLIWKPISTLQKFFYSLIYKIQSPKSLTMDIYERKVNFYILNNRNKELIRIFRREYIG